MMLGLSGDFLAGVSCSYLVFMMLYAAYAFACFSMFIVFLSVLYVRQYSVSLLPLLSSRSWIQLQHVSLIGT